ncbi:efflux RND transporter permease subunit [Candidatus Peregrinibacteria bacterium]|nr:efflux RND transporter permease subunit [Candidatus Peregrinibacteria bacterium]
MEYKELNIVGRIAKIFIDNHRITTLVAMMLVIWGTFAYATLPREQAPEINIPYAVISTYYAGASPEDIESQITNKLETQINEVDDITNITSTSSFSISSIMVEFSYDVDMDDKVQQVQNKVAEVSSQLPEDAGDPSVMKVEMSDFAILDMNLVSTKGLEFLTEKAELLEEELEEIVGVGDVTVSGTLQSEIQINVDANRLALYGVTLDQIARVFYTENVNIPVGDLSINNQNYVLRVLGEFESLTDIRNLVVTYSEDATPIYLRYLATVEETTRDMNSYARVSRITDDGTWEEFSSVGLSVIKRQGDNIIKVGEEIHARIQELQDSGKLGDAELVVIWDGIAEAEKEINNLMRNVGISILIVCAILILFLGIQAALIASMVIPLSLGIAFGMLVFTGMSINGLTLFALILALGMLVDNGIVMVENIYRMVHSTGCGRRKAALMAANEIGIPLISAVLTTISAFVPMLFMTGIMGEYIRVIPYMVVFALSGALFVGIVLVPCFASKFIPKQTEAEARQVKRIRFAVLREKYRTALSLLLHNKKRRRGAIFLLGLLFVGSLALPITGIVPVEMFPSADSSWVTINVTLPQGTELEKSNEATKVLEEHIKTIDGVKHFMALAGAQGASEFDFSLASSSVENSLYFSIMLFEPDEREMTSAEIIELMRGIEAPELVGATITFVLFEEGPPSDDPIVFRVFGDDNDQLQVLAKDLAGILRTVEGTVEIDDGLQESIQEYQIRFDRDKMQTLGLTTTTVASFLRNAQSGMDLGVFRENGEETDIIMRLNEEDRESLEDLEQLQIMTMVGPVPLSTFVEAELAGSLSSISHHDLDKTITIRSQLLPNYNSGQVLAAFQQELEGYDFPNGFGVSFGGEDEEIKESFTNLFYALWVAVVLIYLILIAQFNSYAQPFIILSTMPLALIGVFGGLLVMGMSLNFPGFIGVVALVGIVVNNAILIIDAINKQRQDGLEIELAILEGASRRFRPVVLTTLTTVLAIIPTTLTDEMWGSLGVSIIFGLSFSTLLTLFVIPVLYFIVESRYEIKKQYES